MNNQIEPDTYIERQCGEHSCKDIYFDNINRLFYTIPVMDLGEMRRLSNLKLNKDGGKSE